MNAIYTKITSAKSKGAKAYALLIDPDKLTEKSCAALVDKTNEFPIDYFFVGGSLLLKNNLSAIIRTIKNNSDKPVIIFPGSNIQIDEQADAILFLSLISGRNPDALIGQHVVAAPLLKQSKLEVISTGYILVDCGKPTTVSYISNTSPIPYDKPDIAACTAMAGEMLGMKLIYVDGGSGALQPVSRYTIEAVRNSVDIPIIVGGGIRSKQEAINALNAGADIIVTGNGVENNPSLLEHISESVCSYNTVKK